MADELWVVNASPLVVLAKVGQLDLLLATGRLLIVPEAVASEIHAGAADDAARTALAAGFGGAPVPTSVPSAIAEWGLGRGESAVLSLARERGGTAVIDDRDARRAAAALRISCIGTIGVVLRARVERRIDSAALVFRQLRARGLYFDDELVAAALRKTVGESWE
jgi:predicted nucleic acid-binding protein